MDTTETDFFAAWVRDDRRIGEIPPGTRRARAVRHNERLPFLLTWDCAWGCDGRLRIRYRILGGPVALAAAAWYADRLDGRPAQGVAVPSALEALRVLGLGRGHAVETLMIEDAARETLFSACLRTENRHERRNDRHPLEPSGAPPGGRAPRRPT